MSAERRMTLEYPVPATLAAWAGGVAATLDPTHAAAITAYLGQVEAGCVVAPRRGRGFDWSRISDQAGVPLPALVAVQEHVRPILLAARKPPNVAATKPSKRGRRRGRAPLAIVDLPEAQPGPWRDPESFSRAFDLHIRRHGDTVYRLHRWVVGRGGKVSLSTLAVWRRGAKAPQSEDSLVILRLIETRYRLPSGYFASKRARSPRAVLRRSIPGVAGPEARRLAWHLPDDFADRSAREREEILAWVRTVLVSGATEYRRYQAAAAQHRYGLQFDLPRQDGVRRASAQVRRSAAKAGRVAPPTLNEEMAALVLFKSATLTPAGYRRNGVWGHETAAQRVEHLGLLLGGLAAPSAGPVQGYGASLADFTLGLLAFPAIWDWYIQWRERRRGFYTAWETDLLIVGAALTRAGVGWVRQTPSLADRVKPIAGLIEEADIEVAQADWDAACERTHLHCLARIKQIQHVVRVHRDSFEPILVVLEAESPLAEYRKITEEILRRMPNPRRYPKAAAEAVRAFLMLRVGLHTGLRQRNLRELMVARKGQPARSERSLADGRRGELRWNERSAAWEIYIPWVAFKNANSSFFANRPFRLQLPDLGGLYEQIDAYVERHRAVLLNGALDPGTFFVSSAKKTSKSAAYTSARFYEAWRLAIQRYGIFNPYTGKGAIPGLLPHGPHNVRDVLATHILKQTGSYEQASYAIQDTPDMVAKHYGRFLPQDKASLAAQVLNQAWV